MLPRSATPVDLFETLTINSQMSPTNTDIRARAVEVRDILSSFDRDILPSELRPQIFQQLDRPYQTRPPKSQWTIQEDLPATLLQWGAYDDQAYELLSALQSISTLTRCFYEKLDRRFARLFREYDRLLPEDHGAIRSVVQRIAEDFRKVVMAVGEDRQHRHQGQEAIVQRLLAALIGVCQRHADLVPASRPPTNPRRETRRTSMSNEGPLNLYDALIKRPLEVGASGMFMLDVLETFPATVFTDLQSQHQNLMSLLTTNHAPPAFSYRVQRLPSRQGPVAAQASGAQHNLRSTAAQMAPTSEVEASEPTATTSQTTGQAPPQRPTRLPASSKSAIGSKRSAEDLSTTSKRGRRKKTTE